MTNLASLPHSPECERAVLAALLLRPSIMPEIAAGLRVEDFYLHRNQLLFGAMIELADEGVEIDLRTLQACLEQKGELHQAGGLAYMVGLDMDLPSLDDVGRYADVVAERSTRRQIVTECLALSNQCRNGGDLAADDALDQLEKLVCRLARRRTAPAMKGLNRAFEDAIALLEERAGGSLGLASGFADVDELIQGFAPGGLYVIAGRPGMGKSTLALNVAAHVAFRLCQGVVFMSLEMTTEELAMRLLASEAGLPFTDLRKSDLSERQWRHLYDVIRRLGGAPLLIHDGSSVTLRDVESEARRLVSADPPVRLLVIDYLQLLDAGRGHNTREQAVAAMARRLKVLAKDVGIPILLLSQLNRQPEARKDPRPVLADLRESGAIEQDADLVAFVFREDQYKATDDNVGLAELIVRKHRNGPTGTVPLVFHGDHVTFRSRHE